MKVSAKLTSSHLERFNVGTEPGLWIYLPKHSIGDEQWKELIKTLNREIIGYTPPRIKVTGRVKLEIQEEL